jgi:hypothetical protein
VIAQDKNLKKVAHCRKRMCNLTVFETLESKYTVQGEFFFGLNVLEVV